ncbi:oligosaccharide flippase family protein [Rhizobium azibense]|nr:oligosaccharide flippase family protein [Rhizobium azibense]
MSSREPSSLSTLTAKAGTWTVGSKLASKTLDFITLLCLARLLGPSDFGLVAMAMSSVLIAEAIFEMPVAAALIRDPSPTEDMFNTALTIGLTRGLIVGLLLCALAYPLALFYDEPRLTTLICVLSLAPVMRGLKSPKLILFTQRFDFRPDFILEAAGKIASLCAAVAMALYTGSYWAIAVGTVVGPMLMMIVSYIFAPQRPVLSLKDWSMFAPIVGWYMLSQILQSVNWQLEKLLLPRFMDLVSFGRYSVASDITAVPYQSVVQPLFRPFLVAFSQIPSHEKLGEAYLRATCTIVFLVAPALVFLSILADVVVTLLLGPSWHGAAFILTCLPLIAIISLPTALVNSICFLADKLHLIIVKNVIELFSKLLLICSLGYAYGLNGILAGQAIAAAISLATSLAIVRASIGLGLARQAKEGAKYFAPVLLMALCLVPGIYLGDSVDHPMRQMWLSIATAAAAALVYLGSMFFMARMSSSEGLHEYDFVMQFLRKRFRPAI